MINNDSQVLLTVYIGGRLGAMASKVVKGKPETYHLEQEVKQSIRISSEAVRYFTSAEEGRVHGITPSSWKKMNKEQRLQAHLQRTADYLSGKENTKYTYQVINLFSLNKLISYFFILIKSAIIK